MEPKNNFSGMIFNYTTAKLVSVSETLKNVLLFTDNQTSFNDIFPHINLDDLKAHLKENKEFNNYLKVLNETLEFKIEKTNLEEEPHLIVCFKKDNNLELKKDNNNFPYLYLNKDFLISNVSNNYKTYFKCCKNALNKPFYHNYINSFDADFYQSIKKIIEKENIWYGSIKAETKTGQYEEFFTLITPIVLHNLNLGYVVKYFPSKIMNNGTKEFNNVYSKSSLLHLITKKLLTNLSKKKYIVFIDYNNFKEINDKYGHLSGDQAIQELKEVIYKNFPNDYITRYGGDEFLVFIDREISYQELVDKLTEVESLSNKELSFKASKTKHQLSIGVSKYPTNGITISDLIYSADLAMYIAKKEKTLFKLAFEMEKE